MFVKYKHAYPHKKVFKCWFAAGCLPAEKITYLYRINQGSDSEAGEPADDTRDGQLPVVLVTAAGRRRVLTDTDYLIASVLRLLNTCSWYRVQRERFLYRCI